MADRTGSWHPPAMMDYNMGKAMRHLSTPLQCPCQTCRARRMPQARAPAGTHNGPDEGTPPADSGRGSSIHIIESRHMNFTGRNSFGERDSSLPMGRITPEVDGISCNAAAGVMTSSYVRHSNLRDTFGVQVPQGTGDLVGPGHGLCSTDMNCDENCGYGTGCAASCTRRTQPGTPSTLPQLRVQDSSYTGLALGPGASSACGGRISEFEGSGFGANNGSAAGISGCGVREFDYSGTSSALGCAGSLIRGGDSVLLGGPGSVSRGGASLVGAAYGRDILELEEATTVGRPQWPPPGPGRQPNNTLRGPVGIDLFRNEHINLVLTLMVEILGVLIFFAVCTISFWITLGYYVVKLSVDLKNADKRVKTAAAILVGLLLVAFLVTLVTNREDGFCCRRSRAKPKSRWSLNICPRLKGVINYCSMARGKAKGACPKAKPAACPKCKAPPKCPKCKAAGSDVKQKAKPATVKMPKLPVTCWLGKCNIQVTVFPKNTKLQKKVQYSDKQGRAIFQNSKRYAIPSEMKQPPTWMVWVRDLIANLLGY